MIINALKIRNSNHRSATNFMVPLYLIEDIWSHALFFKQYIKRQAYYYTIVLNNVGIKNAINKTQESISITLGKKWKAEICVWFFNKNSWLCRRVKKFKNHQNLWCIRVFLNSTFLDFIPHWDIMLWHGTSSVQSDIWSLYRYNCGSFKNDIACYTI